MILYIFSPGLIITGPWGLNKCSSWFSLYSPQNMGFPERVLPDWWTSTSFWELFLLAIFWLVGELQYFLGFPPLTISLDPDMTISLLLHDFWTLENVYVLFCLLWDFLPLSSAPVFYVLLRTGNIPLCISAAWPRTWPWGVVGSQGWIHINLCGDGEIGQGSMSLQKPSLLTFTFYGCENWSPIGDKCPLRLCYTSLHWS